MSPTSYRQTWHHWRTRLKLDGLDLRDGLAVGRHPFYWAVAEPTLPAHTVKKRASAFPYRSVRTLIDALQWPAEFRPTTNHDNPKDAAPGWTDKLQGVTHDDSHWYFAQEDRLWRIPVAHDLNVDPDHAASPVLHRTFGPDLPGSNHFGDLDFYRPAGSGAGVIYVAVEGQNPAVVAVFDRELRFVASAHLHPLQGPSGPWCAVNPANGLLYSSAFNDSPGPIRLQVYERSIVRTTPGNKVQLELEHLGSMELFDENGASFSLGGIQGAAFSKRGHLYLIVDTTMMSADVAQDRGVMGFDMITGRRVVHRLVDYHPWKHFKVPPVGWQKVQELEGITLWEGVEHLTAGLIDGQLHVIMLDKDFATSDDDLYFKHYEVTVPEDRDKI